MFSIWQVNAKLVKEVVIELCYGTPGELLLDTKHVFKLFGDRFCRCEKVFIQVGPA